MQTHGFSVCPLDSGDELIRTLGIETVERVIEAEGELGSLRTLRGRPAQRARSAPDQLRRFIGAGPVTSIDTRAY